MADVCPSNQTECLLRAILDANSKFSWDPLNFAFTAAIGALALIIAIITVFQGLLAAGPGRFKGSQMAIGDFSRDTRTSFSWTELRLRTVAKVPVIQEPDLSLHIAAVDIYRKRGLLRPKSKIEPLATWVRLLTDTELDQCAWRTAQSLTDYLPAEFPAAPAFVRIDTLLMLSILAGCTDYQISGSSASASGPSIQLDIRTHAITGPVASYQRFGQVSNRTEIWHYINTLGEDRDYINLWGCSEAFGTLFLENIINKRSSATSILRCATTSSGEIEIWRTNVPEEVRALSRRKRGFKLSSILGREPGPITQDEAPAHRLIESFSTNLRDGQHVSPIYQIMRSMHPGEFIIYKDVSERHRLTIFYALMAGERPKVALGYPIRMNNPHAALRHAWIRLSEHIRENEPAFRVLQDHTYNTDAVHEWTAKIFNPLLGPGQQIGYLVSKGPRRYFALEGSVRRVESSVPPPRFRLQPYCRYEIQPLQKSQWTIRVKEADRPRVFAPIGNDGSPRPSKDLNIDLVLVWPAVITCLKWLNQGPENRGTKGVISSPEETKILRTEIFYQIGEIDWWISNNCQLDAASCCLELFSQYGKGCKVPIPWEPEYGIYKGPYHANDLSPRARDQFDYIFASSKLQDKEGHDGQKYRRALKLLIFLRAALMGFLLSLAVDTSDILEMPNRHHFVQMF